GPGDARGWVPPKEFEAGRPLAAACPGPLAYRLAVSLGSVRFGFRGAIAAAAAFALAPFALVIAVAAFYTRFAGAWQMRALFYGIAPAVVALIVKACWNLGRTTL